MKLQGVVAAVVVGSVSAQASMWQDWKPQPASDLGAAATAYALQSMCEGQYMGADCSEKVCAYGLSSNVSPFLSTEADEGDNVYAPSSNLNQDAFNGATRMLKDGGVHTYSECSSQGICDRTTGTCNCFDGYTGKGCRRTVCPNDCSGHGMCSRNVDANWEYATTDAPNMMFATQYWDGEKTMRCQCDRGYEGPDCSDRICPHGDDVLTTCAVDSNHDTQIITFVDPSSDFSTQQAAGGAPLFYTLTFEDHFGGMYKTHPIALNADDNANAGEAQAALEALPNSAIPSVQVAANGLMVTVSFTNTATTGKQNTLIATIVNSEQTCAEGGQQPYTENSVALDTVTVSVAHQDLADTDSTYEENVPCGNRGICDSSVGKCECFEGHTGEACEIQSVYV
jgi:hypothetical protein